MQSPFWQHMQDLFNRLQGTSMIVALVVWILIFGVGLLCAFGGISLPARDKEPDPEATAQALPTATLAPAGEGASGGDAPSEPITLPTPTTKPGGATADGTVQPLPWGAFGYGIAAHGIVMPYYTMDQVKYQLGFDWVKQQVRWDHFSPGPGQMDWSGYDAMVDAASERELKVMMSVVGAPDWSRTYYDDNPEASPPDDFNLYVDFLAEMVERYKGKIHAIEVWNEQNLDREWDTPEGVKASAYVELLKLSYQKIKDLDPSIIVISGALSPVGASATDPANPNRVIYMDDFQYFQAMVDAGFLSYADCVGAHHNGINMPPDVSWDEGYDDPTAAFRGPFDNPDHSWSFKSTLMGYNQMVQQAGFNKPLCITEFGWATAEGMEGYPPGFEFALDNTLQEQAEWDVQAFQLLREWGFVHLAFLWNLDYSYKGGIGATDPNAPYSILDLQGAARPAYDALSNMPKTP